MLDIKELKGKLEQKVLAATNVIIIPHNGIDFDAIGSAIGIAVIVKKLKRNVCIVVNDPIYKIDHGVQIIINEAREQIQIINRDEYLQSKAPDDLFILTDVNKNYLVSLKEELNPENTIIIDHHDEDSSTIKTSERYIDTSVSSASEIITKLLPMFKIKLNSQFANYLLAGIYLDTNKFTKNVSSETMKMMAKLLEMGANMNVITDLFAEDFISDRRVQELVSKAKISTLSIAIVCAEEDAEYTREELAKVADYLLKYKVDAAFAIGNIGDGVISVSARSKEKVNVAVVMHKLKGGGNQFSAAAKLKGTTIEATAEKLREILQPPCYIK